MEEHECKDVTEEREQCECGERNAMLSAVSRQLEHQVSVVTKEKGNLLIEKPAYQEEIKELRRKVESLYGSLSSSVRENLSKCFSQSQVNEFLEGKRFTHWQEEDIYRSLALRSLSSKAYSFLRKQVCFPLPSVTTLNRWVLKLDAECGILFSVLHLLKQKALTVSEYDRLCVLSFDEISVAHQWSYDNGTGTIHSPKVRFSVQ